MRKTHLFIVLALLAAVPFALPATASAQISVGVSVRFGPPPLRVVAVQPIAPGPGYFWTPGYWAYSPAGYYWVPGAWVLAPAPGMLWTPGYWGYGDGLYIWHAGYWGPHVGFYGGINYGFGYFGAGFVGGRWAGGRFFYNTAVWRVNTTVIHTTYVDRTVVRNVEVNRVSYNGGAGGVRAQASPEEMRYAQERHLAATPAQSRRENRARTVASRNGGFRPEGAARGGRDRQNAARNGRRNNATRGERANAQEGKAKNSKDKKKDDRRGPGGPGGPR